ncbi:hypothetical protein, partial [Liquorilactobacillus vini]|uniref:hypothetical protein n=1 Tax=Liquorilactobacillus vini TaxID=238015 RepID=UPI00191BD845
MKIYKNQLDLRRTNCLPFYFLYGNQIVSPGQCLIKKSSIPHEWLESKLDINGADDWLLWVMMLVKGKKFVMNDDYLYTHNNLEHNTSDDENKMIQSS